MCYNTAVASELVFTTSLWLVDLPPWDTRPGYIRCPFKLNLLISKGRAVLKGEKCCKYCHDCGCCFTFSNYPMTCWCWYEHRQMDTQLFQCQRGAKTDTWSFIIITTYSAKKQQWTKYCIKIRTVTCMFIIKRPHARFLQPRQYSDEDWKLL